MINSQGSDTRPKKVYYPLDKLKSKPKGAEGAGNLKQNDFTL